MTTYTSAPIVNPFFAAKGAEGSSLAGGLVYLYYSGTDLPLTTYSDHTLTTPNPWPVVLNAQGYAPIWIDPDVPFKIRLDDINGVQQPNFPVDMVQSAPSSSEPFGAFPLPPKEQDRNNLTSLIPGVVQENGQAWLYTLHLENWDAYPTMGAPTGVIAQIDRRNLLDPTDTFHLYATIPKSVLDATVASAEQLVSSGIALAFLAQAPYYASMSIIDGAFYLSLANIVDANACGNVPTVRSATLWALGSVTNTIGVWFVSKNYSQKLTQSFRPQANGNYQTAINPGFYLCNYLTGYGANATVSQSTGQTSIVTEPVMYISGSAVAATTNVIGSYCLSQSWEGEYVFKGIYSPSSIGFIIPKITVNGAHTYEGTSQTFVIGTGPCPAPSLAYKQIWSDSLGNSVTCVPNYTSGNPFSTPNAYYICTPKINGTSVTFYTGAISTPWKIMASGASYNVSNNYGVAFYTVNTFLNTTPTTLFVQANPSIMAQVPTSTASYFMDNTGSQVANTLPAVNSGSNLVGIWENGANFAGVYMSNPALNRQVYSSYYVVNPSALTDHYSIFSRLTASGILHIEGANGPTPGIYLNDNLLYFFN